MFDLVYSICDKGAHDSLPATFDYPCRHWRIDVALFLAGTCSTWMYSKLVIFNVTIFGGNWFFIKLAALDLNWHNSDCTYSYT